MTQPQTTQIPFLNDRGCRVAVLFEIIADTSHEMRDHPFYKAIIQRRAKLYDDAKSKGLSFMQSARIANAVAVVEVLNER